MQESGTGRSGTRSTGDARLHSASLGDRIFICIVFCLLSAVLANAIRAMVVPGVQLHRMGLLEGRYLADEPQVSTEHILSGGFQEEAESFVADSVPGREPLLLLNGMLSRFGIESANLVFRYEAYPAYFGAKVLIVPGRNRLMSLPYREGENRRNALHRSAEALNRIVVAHPGVHWTMLFPDTSPTTSSNPAFRLGNGYADQRSLVEGFTDALDGSVGVIALEVESAEEFDRLFFHSDHHWQVEGGLIAYNLLAEVYGLPSIDLQPTHVLNERPFIGYYGREARVTRFSDEVRDVDFETDEVQVWIDLEEADPLDLGVSINGQTAEDVRAYRSDEVDEDFVNCYALYFHSDRGITHVHNDAAPERSLLIVSDSYSNCIDRFFIPSYRDIYLIDPRYYGLSLSGFLDGTPVDDGIIILGPSTYIWLYDKDCMKG